MRISGQLVGTMAAVGVLVGASSASAQSLGAFTWQLQPFCNRVTVTVTQNGAIYTMDGFDDQCGAAQRAPVVGVATPNPDGSIGFGWTLVTVPGGKPVHVDARIDLASIGGPWSDSAGNSGTLVLGGPGAGSPRPLPAGGLAPGSVTSAALAPGAVTSASLAAGSVGPTHVATNAVTSAAIADGSVAGADVNSAQVQLRLSGTCASGQYMTGASAAGVPTCTPQLGVSNTALGLFALQSVIGAAGNNTAIGNAALRDSSSGNNNTAVGQGAMLLNTTGQQNVAVGGTAMLANTTGTNNVAVGLGALQSSSVGGQNVAVGFSALFSATNSSNTALGYQAGANVTTGGSNVLIANAGTAADSGRIRIGTAGAQTTAFLAGVRGVTVATGIPVIIGTDGQLGTTTSSRRYKFDIADMGDFSSRLARLRPVTFRYTQPVADGSTPLDFGLIAEEVADVFPELAVRNADGQIETVAYHKLPALLVNELQAQQRVISEQREELAAVRRLIDELRSDLARLVR